MPYLPPDPQLDQQFSELIALSKRGPIDVALREKANTLALRIRSRCIDLATWKADYSSEYEKREEQCRALTVIAAESAHPFLLKEFGQGG